MELQNWFSGDRPREIRLRSTDSECVQRNAENFKNESAEKEEYTTDNQNPQRDPNR